MKNVRDPKECQNIIVLSTTSQGIFLFGSQIARNNTVREGTFLDISVLLLQVLNLYGVSYPVCYVNA